MEAAATRYYDQIKAQVNADTRKRAPDGPLTNQQFDMGYQSVLAVVRGRLGALRTDLTAN